MYRSRLVAEQPVGTPRMEVSSAEASNQSSAERPISQSQQDPLLPKHPPTSNKSFIRQLIECCLPSRSDSSVTPSNYSAITSSDQTAPRARNAQRRRQLRRENNSSTVTASEAPVTPAQAKLDELLAEQKALIHTRMRSRRHAPGVYEIIDKDLKSLEKMKSLIGGIIDNIDHNAPTIEIFIKISEIIRTGKNLEYNISKSRSVYDLAYHGNGDCKAFCNLYNFIANDVLAKKNIDYEYLEGYFAINLKHDQQIPGCTSGKKLEFARHTILSVTDDMGEKRFFDPVFGVEVDHTQYGKDMDRYLLN